MDIEGWYRRYGESVYRRCLRLCRDPQQAIDLTQEVFLRAHRYADSYRAEASPMTWLFTLSDRCFFDALTKNRPLPKRELQEFLASEHDDFEGRFVSHDLVLRLLERASDDVRAIVIHRYFDELELEEIARRLAVNERTVRRKLEQFLAAAAKLIRSER